MSEIRTPMEQAIEELKSALAEVKEPFASVGIETERQWISGPVRVKYRGYSWQASIVISDTLSGLVDALNQATPVSRLLEDAKDLEARAARLRNEAAELEGK